MSKPAIEGGTATRKTFLIFGRPKISAAEVREVMDTIRSGWLGTGPKTQRFESLFATYVQSKFAIGVNSCTAGIHLALDVLGVRDGDEVITSPLTFPSAANVVVHHRAIPTFADVELASWNIDPKEIEKKLTKKTKAIIPVHLHGRPCAIDRLNRLARRNKLYVIEDAAHAAEAWYRGKKIGSISDFSAFSFYVTKNIMTGEGGMLTTNNKNWAEEARIRSLHGISKDAWKRYSAEGFQPYETLYPGYKYNMMDLVASFGLHQLAHVESNLKTRQKYWEMYDEAFATLPELILPAKEEEDTVHARHLYAILVRPEKLKIDRNQFIEALKAENIGAGVHFTALHLHKFYRETFGFRHGDFPNAEFVGDRTISLPLSAALTKRDVQDVIAAVEKIVDYYRRP